MNEELSNNYILKRNELSGEFVVCERVRPMRTFNFFNRKTYGMQEEQNTTPMQPTTPIQPSQPQMPSQPNPPSNPPQQNAPTQPQRPTPPPIEPQRPVPPPMRPNPPQTPNESVLLARNLYNLLRVLKAEYSSLATLNADSADYFNSLSTQTAILENTALNIYKTLSGNNSAPNQTYQTPTFLSFCDGIRQTINTMQLILQTIARMQQIISVSSIDRELLIMYTIINTNLSTMNTYKQECDARGL